VGGESKVIGYEMIYALVKYEYEYSSTLAYCVVDRVRCQEKKSTATINASELS
jgi:hypothetical protein